MQAIPIVVVNGRDVDPEVVDWLRSDERIRFIVDPSADKRLATAIGRDLVKTPYFGFLDDDDELLPGALAMRVEYLERDPALDCLATNGIFARTTQTVPVFKETQDFRGNYRAPILRERNWLASCGALFRSASIEKKYFDELSAHREWTLIAYRIACNRNVLFVDVPTYRVNETPGSQSKTDTYVEAKSDMIARMLQWCTDPRERRVLERARGRAFHIAASHHRIKGQSGRAWQFHLKSVLAPGGLRYTPYTALLLAGCSLSLDRLREAFTPRRASLAC